MVISMHKDDKFSIIFISIIVIIGIYSIMTIEENMDNYALGSPNLESGHEGMRETIVFIKENCTYVFANHFYRVLMEPYDINVSSSWSFNADCVVKGSLNTSFDVTPYIEQKNCTLEKIVSKKYVLLIEIYSCEMQDNKQSV